MQRLVGQHTPPIPMTATITTAPSLLRGVLPQPVPRFAPFWFRNELIGAVSPEWISRLDPRLFHIETRGQSTKRLAGKLADVLLADL